MVHRCPLSATGRDYLTWQPPPPRCQVKASLLILAAASGSLGCLPGGPVDISVSDSIPVPLNQLITGTYKGFSGGLYPGSDDAPAEHAAEAVLRAKAVAPMDTAGNPDPKGKYVLLSIGMSNTTQEFCSESGASPCGAWTFMGQAAGDGAVNHSTLVIVNGAAGAQFADTWESPTAANYDRIRDTRLNPAGLSERQVQIVWLKVANAQPTTTLPDTSADAYQLERRMGNMVRALNVRYPNLQLVFISSRIWGGYSTTGVNPEPYAYESGFSVKWLIQAQINQIALGSVQDTVAGSLDYRSVAPWIGWGPYLWAFGFQVRSDGLQWLHSDFQTDGMSPSQAGEEKVGKLLLDFFSLMGYTRCWFLVGEVCR